MTRATTTSTLRCGLLLLAGLLGVLGTPGPARAAAVPGTGQPGDVIEFALDAGIVESGATVRHASPVGPGGSGWVKINGEKVTNKRITINLWKGNPKRRAAISGRADGNGKWDWKERPKSQGYAPFDIEEGDVIHVICTNGEPVDRCYKIEEVRTDVNGKVVYFRGSQVPC